MLNAIIVTTSFYCVIVKMVILHDAMKTIQNGVLVFFLKKDQNLFLSKRKPKTGFCQPCVAIYYWLAGSSNHLVLFHRTNVITLWAKLDLQARVNIQNLR